MAPTAPPSKPSARTLRHQRITGQIHPLLPPKLARANTASTDTFLSTKKDKRTIKSSTFLSRIASSTSKISKKRRRPAAANKLANLGGLADALPEVEERSDKLRRESLKSKKGALKRKERVVRGEMERFNAVGGSLLANMPEETVECGSTKIPAATANRWAALRGYISSTMETNPAFNK